MANHVPNIILSIVLIGISVVWTWLVIMTIPAGFGDGEIGARAFPLTCGILLLLLAGALFLVEQVKSKNREAYSKRDKSQTIKKSELDWKAALIVLVEITLYGFLLEKIGFVLSTPIIICIVMLINLRVKSFLKIFLMAIGLTIGCWLIFEKILGLYLANGIWVNIG
mgnify:CR=1 FL=1